MSWEPPEQFERDAKPPYGRRVYLPAYETLDPAGLPWAEMRKYPERFPGRHIAKVASARTVVGMDFTPPGEESRRIYVKRSYLRSPFKRLVSRWQPSKEWREFQLSLEFRAEGIAVPAPVFYAEATRGHLFPTRYLATEGLGERWLCARQYFASEVDFDERWELLALFTRRLHRSRLLHADYRADHLFLNREYKGGEGDVTEAWTLIDLDGSRTGSDPGPREVRRVLLQLAESLLPAGLGPEHLRRFLDRYDQEGRFGFDAERLHHEAHERRRIKSLRPPGKKKKS